MFRASPDEPLYRYKLPLLLTLDLLVDGGGTPMRQGTVVVAVSILAKRPTARAIVSASREPQLALPSMPGSLHWFPVMRGSSRNTGVLSANAMWIMQ